MHRIKWLQVCNHSNYKILKSPTAKNILQKYPSFSTQKKLSLNTKNNNN